MKRRDARRQALNVVYESDLRERSMLKTLAEANDVDSYARKIVEGIDAHESELDALISEHSSRWDLDRMSLVDRSILRIGAWEITHTDLAPAIAIDEAVELAKEFGGPSSSGFVNGILAAVASRVSEHPRGGATGANRNT